MVWKNYGLALVQGDIVEISQFIKFVKNWVLKSVLLCHFFMPSPGQILPLFWGIGKKTSWNTWEAIPEMTEVSTKIANEPDTVSLESDLMSSI